MALTKIEKGTLADSTVVNDNFEYLDDRISSTAYQLKVSDATILSTLNSQISSVNETINELTDSLSDVADDVTSLNTSNGSKISATVSKSSNGYCKFSNGIVMQWGYNSMTGTSATVTLPTAFSGTGYHVVAVHYGSVAAGNCTAVGSFTTTSFVIIIETSASSGMRTDWFAIGY